MAEENARNMETGYYHFHWIDYTVFGSMLVLSAMSGVYFGYCRKRRTPTDTVVVDTPGKGGDFGSKSMNEYLLGSRKLKPFPVAMSLVAR